MGDKPAGTFAFGRFMSVLKKHFPWYGRYPKQFLTEFFERASDQDVLQAAEDNDRRSAEPADSCVPVGVWRGVNTRDLPKYFNASRPVPPWKAAILRSALTLDALWEMLDELGVDAQGALVLDLGQKFGIHVDDFSKLPEVLYNVIRHTLTETWDNPGTVSMPGTTPLQETLFEMLPLSKGAIRGDKLQLGKSSIVWPVAPKPPADPDSNIEGGYLHQLCCAFSNHDGQTYNDVSEIPAHHRDEFAEQRINFWNAFGLGRNIRDTFPDGEERLEELKQEIYDGVIDVCRCAHASGLQRMRQTLTQSTTLSLQAICVSEIPAMVKHTHRKGLCHVLVNEHRLEWVSQS